jgi:hypothetical protein
MNSPTHLKLFDKDEVAKILKEATDWTGTCRKCGKTVSGTIEDLKGHVCNGEKSK